jgi:hypothetical protein
MFWTRESTLLEQVTERALRALNRHDVGSKEYTQILNHVALLHEMKEKERPKSVSRDTWVIVGANILGIFMVINHEYANPITSRALNLILKPR